MAQKITIPNSILQNMYMEYKECSSVREVANRHGYTMSTAYRYMKEAGFDIKMDYKSNGNRIRKFNIDERFFEEINTRDKAYIFGWLLSDGSLNDKTSSKQVRLKITDLDVLEQIKIRLGYSQPLYEANQDYSTKRTQLLVITSEQMFNDLVRHGCTPRKSFTKRFPVTIQQKLIPDFIRGYFEGNGSIYTYLNHSKHLSGEIKIVSSSFLCEGLMNYLKSIGIDSYIDKDKRCDDRVSNLRIRKLPDVKLFMELIYNNLDGQVFLKRKYDKFMELNKYREGLTNLTTNQHQW